MKRLIYTVVLCLLIFAGCESFFTTGDSIAEDANTVATGARGVLDSPAGQLIPPDIRLYGLLGISLISGLANAWQEWRNRTMKKTTKAIVQGIENATKSTNPLPDVKASIAKEMRRQGGDQFYVKANRIVDQLKIL